MMRRVFQAALLTIILLINLSCESSSPPLKGLLAVSVDMEEGYQVVLLDLEKEKEEPIKMPMGSASPSFSRDGDTLYYTSPVRVGNLQINQIFRLDLETRQSSRVSDGTANDDFAMPHPFGKRIAFMSHPVSVEKPADTEFRIYLMDQDGKDRRLLEPEGTEPQLCPSWSPNGSKMVYVSRTPMKMVVEQVKKEREAKEKAGMAKEVMVKELQEFLKKIYHSTLRVYDFSTGTSREILSQEYFADYPSWSPKGDLIAFTVQGTGLKHNSLYIVKPDGTGLERITEGPDDRQPSWTPDGKSLLFSRGKGKKRIICEVDVKSKKVRTILDRISGVTDKKGEMAFENPRLYHPGVSP